MSFAAELRKRYPDLPIWHSYVIHDGDLGDYLPYLAIDVQIEIDGTTTPSVCASTQEGMVVREIEIVA